MMMIDDDEDAKRELMDSDVETPRVPFCFFGPKDALLAAFDAGLEEDELLPAFKRLEAKAAELI